MQFVLATHGNPFLDATQPLLSVSLNGTYRHVLVSMVVLVPPRLVARHAAALL